MFLIAVLIAVSMWMRLDQFVVVSILEIDRWLRGGFAETGQRVNHIDKLMDYGKHGRRAARSYVVGRFWHDPPSGYAIGMLHRVEPAIIGLTEEQLLSLLGPPDEISDNRGETKRLTYVGAVAPSGSNKKGIVFLLSDGHVSDTEVWWDFLDEHGVWRRHYLNEKGDWVTRE
jgi:hypothetical protein